MGVSGDAQMHWDLQTPFSPHSQHALPSGPSGVSHKSVYRPRQVPGAQVGVGLGKAVTLGNATVTVAGGDPRRSPSPHPTPPTMTPISRTRRLQLAFRILSSFKPNEEGFSAIRPPGRVPRV